MPFFQVPRTQNLQKDLIWAMSHQIKKDVLYYLERSFVLTKKLPYIVIFYIWQMDILSEEDHIVIPLRLYVYLFLNNFDFFNSK